MVASPRTAGGPRLIDVDVLLYGDRVVDSAEPDLQIPHPRMAQRAFVLVPLAEVIPDRVVPPGSWTVQRLLELVDDRGWSCAVGWGTVTVVTSLGFDGCYRSVR